MKSFLCIGRAKQEHRLHFTGLRTDWKTRSSLLTPKHQVEYESEPTSCDAIISTAIQHAGKDESASSDAVDCFFIHCNPHIVLYHYSIAIYLYTLTDIPYEEMQRHSQMYSMHTALTMCAPSGIWITPIFVDYALNLLWASAQHASKRNYKMNEFVFFWIRNHCLR